MKDLRPEIFLETKELSALEAEKVKGGRAELEIVDVTKEKKKEKRDEKK